MQLSPWLIIAWPFHWSERVWDSVDYWGSEIWLKALMRYEMLDFMVHLAFNNNIININSEWYSRVCSGLCKSPPRGHYCRGQIIGETSPPVHPRTKRYYAPRDHVLVCIYISDTLRNQLIEIMGSRDSFVICVLTIFIYSTEINYVLTDIFWKVGYFVLFSLLLA